MQEQIEPPRKVINPCGKLYPAENHCIPLYSRDDKAGVRPGFYVFFDL